MLFTLGAYGVAAGAATGQEAVVAVGVFAFTLFVVGIVWPIWSLARVDVAAVAPTDATVGDAARAARHDHGPRGRGSTCARSIRPGAWWRTAAPDRRAGCRTPRRGAACSGRCASSCGPRRRSASSCAPGRVRVALPAPIVVAPRPSVAPAVLQPIPDERVSSGSPLLVHGGGDTVRAVRPYAPGDPARLVHWPTSARRGEIVVREHEPPPALGIALVVDLRGPIPEAAASLRRRHRHRDARGGRRGLVRHVRGR